MRTLKMYFEEKELSITDIYNMIGISSSAVYEFINSQGEPFSRRIPGRYLIAAAELLRTSPGTVLDDYIAFENYAQSLLAALLDSTAFIFVIEALLLLKKNLIVLLACIVMFPPHHLI